MKFTGEFFIPRDAENDNGDNFELELEHKHRYLSILTLVEGKTVLDIASGEGYGTYILASKAGQTFGVDINLDLVEHASRKYQRENIRFLQGSVDRIPLAPGTIDVVVSFETLEHVTSDLQQQFFREAKRVLRPDGVFIVSTPNKKNYTDRYAHHNKFHLHELYKDDLEELIKTHFRHFRVYEQGQEVVSLILHKEDYLSQNTAALIPITNGYHFEGKYLIGFCSDLYEAILPSLASVVPESEKSYFQLIDRILQLQQEVEGLGSWGRENAKSLEIVREDIILYQDTIKKRQEDLAQAIADLAGMARAQAVLNAALADKENILSEQNRKIHALYQQRDVLNSKISEIYASEGWKLLSMFYRIRDAALPKGSSRHRNIKKAVNWLRRKKSDDIIIQDHSGPELIPFDKAAPGKIEPFEFPYFTNPQISIIIPAYNGWEMNYACLRSIRENTDGSSYEVIFADDVSIDETRHVDQYIKNIVHIRNEKNLGFIRNCNHAASVAKGEYLHFLNNDTEVTPGWLSSLVNLMEKDQSIGMAGSKLVYPDGRLQEAGGIIWQDGSGWNYGNKQDPEAPAFNYVKEVDYVSGASIMIRKDLWKKLGGFDERYAPAYCEDSDLAFSIRKEGYKVVYQPLSRVIHYEGFSHGRDNDTQNSPTGIKSYQKVNSEKFAEKWRSELGQQMPNAIDPYWTRDRSRHKKTILVIDHYVPHFDKDAGSRTVFQYLNLFVDLGLNVKFIGDNLYRHEPYTSILQQKGIEVLYGSYYVANLTKWLEDNDRYIDYIFLNRPHISIKYIDHLKNKMHGKIFYYTHDLHFFRELKEYEITKEKELLSSSNRWKETEYSLFADSDVILTPSFKEKEVIVADFPGKDVRVMPAFFYPTIGDPINNFKDRKDILFIGGFGHGPNPDALLWFIHDIFPKIRDKNMEIRLIVVGSKMPDKITKLGCADIIIKGFVTDEELEDIYRHVRFSVIPLRYGSGVKGKTVESLSKGLPVVSTSFGLEGLADIETFLRPYDSPHDFAEAVIDLYDDPDKLEALSVSAVRYAQKHFTETSAKIFFKDLLHV